MHQARRLLSRGEIEMLFAQVFSASGIVVTFAYELISREQLTFLTCLLTFELEPLQQPHPTVVQR